MPHSKEAKEIAQVVDSLNPEQRQYVRALVFRVSALTRDLSQPKKKKLAKAVLGGPKHRIPGSRGLEGV